MSDDTPLHQPHDKLFKSTFSDPDTAAAFLRTQLAPTLAASLDWRRLQVEEVSFIDSQLKGRACDLLYRVPCRSSGGEEKEVLLYVLFEHQREEDHWLPFRLLVYMVRIWERFHREQPEVRQLPPILPVVLAQNARSWQVSVRFHDMIDAPPEWDTAAWSLVPGFAYHLAQLAEMPFETIPGTPMGMLTLRALKAERLGDLLGAPVWDEDLLEQLPAEAVERLLRYIYACGDIDTESFARRVQEVISPQLRATAMTLGQRFEEKGRQEGRQEGRHAGQMMAKQQAILEALEIRFERVPTGLREEIESITDLDRLSHLLRAAIRSVDFEAFSREL